MNTPKHLPADLRDWIKARTVEIGAEMDLRPDRGRFGKAGSMQRANLVAVLTSITKELMPNALSRTLRHEIHSDKETKMSEQQNLKTIQEVYEAFGRCDVAFIVDQLTDDIRWVSHFDPVVPWSGDFSGKNGFRTSSRRFFSPST
jgi:hypothetical protein